MAFPFWRVALLSQPYTALTYKVPAWLPHSVWETGLRVLVPLGNSLRLGVLLEPDPAPAPDLAYREILWPAQAEPSFSPDYLEFMRDLSVRQACSPGRVLAAVFPAAWKNSALVFETADGSRIKAADLKRASLEQLERFAADWISGRMRIKPVAGREESFFQVTGAPPWGVRPAAKNQLELLDFLWNRGRAGRSEIRSALGEPGVRALCALQKKRLVGECEPEKDAPKPFSRDTFGFLHPLIGQQQTAFQTFCRIHSSGESRALLVHGVTGSGKTRVYLEMIRFCLARGENVLLLAPEVAIAMQLFAHACAALGSERVFLFHGYQGSQTRERLFEQAATLRSVCIVGTRSALFLPVFRPGLIVLDEEHDTAFKQEERLVYQAKELAWYLVDQSGGTLVLGSATPDVKTFFAASQGRIELVRMKERVADRSLPLVATIDLKTEQPVFGGIFSRPCHQALMECLEQGEQAIIMHNRRGYAPVVYCESCANPYTCPHCRISLTYHKKQDRLVCHYCGFSVFFPSACSHCGGLSCSAVGEGTEKLEEYLRANLPEHTGILRLDRDSTRQKGRMEEILECFGRGEAQVLIGTQMLSKGHDFPNVTLVLVVDGDMGLNAPDYRGTERTFQLLVQVAGRAGRGEKKGRVLIQTRNPQHYCWQYIRENNYQGFYEQELELRRRFSYPPFTCLGLIRMSYPVQSGKGERSFARFQQAVRLESTSGLRLLGPVPSPLAMLGGRLRYQCLVKAQNWQDIRRVYARVRQFCTDKDIRLSFDPDPLSML